MSDKGKKKSKNLIEDLKQTSSCKIFIGGIDQNMPSDDLINYFSTYGNVKGFYVIQNPVTGRCRGFGFLSFENKDSAKNCAELRYHDICNHIVEVKLALPGYKPKKFKKNNKDYQNSPNSPKLIITGIKSSITKNDLKHYFSKYFEKVRIIMNENKLILNQAKTAYLYPFTNEYSKVLGEHKSLGSDAKVSVSNTNNNRAKRLVEIDTIDVEKTTSFFENSIYKKNLMYNTGSEAIDEYNKIQ